MTIFIAERQVLDKLRPLLKEQDDCMILGNPQPDDVLLTQVSKAEPYVILSDWNLPDPQPHRFMQAQRECCPGTKLVVRSVKPEHEGTAQNCGLVDFISKQISAKAFTTLWNNMSDNDLN